MLERSGSIAAPLLATVSFALIGIILPLPSGTVRWPDTALLLLVAAGLLLVGSLQAVFWDRGADGGWGFFARLLYDTGTLALIAAITLLLVPGSKSLSGVRLFTVIMASVGFILEFIWALVGLVLDRRGAFRQAAARRTAALIAEAAATKP